MIDQLYDREYRAARANLNGAISRALSRLFTGAAQAFKVLNRIEYSSPWDVRRGRVRCR